MFHAQEGSISVPWAFSRLSGEVKGSGIPEWIYEADTQHALLDNQSRALSCFTTLVATILKFFRKPGLSEREFSHPRSASPLAIIMYDRMSSSSLSHPH